MKGFKLGLLCMLAVALAFSLATAAGDAAKGKALFNDAHFAGGTAGKSCNSCHPDGKGLDKAGGRADLKNIINMCIESALKGKALDLNSVEMADVVAYIESLKAKE